MNGTVRNQPLKIGGLRIELGEVIAAAERCPGVHQARVLLAPTNSASLALFVASPHLDEVALEEHLRNELPADRQPRHLFILAQLPVNHGGKVDRAALVKLLEQRLAERSSCAR